MFHYGKFSKISFMWSLCGLSLEKGKVTLKWSCLDIYSYKPFNSTDNKCTSVGTEVIIINKVLSPVYYETTNIPCRIVYLFYSIPVSCVCSMCS